MALGPTIRRIREARGLSLSDLARRSRVSASMLSRIERSEKNPTVPLACRIAEALDTTLSHLVGEVPRSEVVVVPARERQVLRDPQSGFERQILSPTFPTRGIEFLYNVIPVGQGSGEFPPHRPGVEEYLVVAEGRLEARVGTEVVRLGRGDALYFEADVAHGFTNVGRGACAYYLVINSVRAAARRKAPGPRRPAARMGRPA